MTDNAPRRRKPAAKKTMHDLKRLQPGSDAKLKRVFAAIGVPEKTPFKPDPFQVDAVDALAKGDCLVTAPTGSGKTWIAEQAIARVFRNQGKAWYASPLKALTNSKYAEFSGIFGPENVGILTGDRKENVEAPIIIGTTEILRNQLYDAMHKGQDLATDFVILDEAHFLGDEERGVVWEEILIYLPVRIPLLLLSATIGNAHQIRGWLEAIRKTPCTVIEAQGRPVPLYPLFLHPSGTLFPFLRTPVDADGKRGLYKKVANFVSARHSPRMSSFRQLPPLGDILGILEKYRLLPAIFFMKSRADCDNALLLCALGGREEDPERRETRIRRVSELTAACPHVANHKQLHHMINLAVAAHHSGQLPAWKLIIETLMTEGLLDAVFATSTVAAGVNFPARTIMMLNSDRFNGRDFMPLTATEFHQMTGRAGRRGMDNIGFAIVIPGKFMDIRLVEKLFNDPPSPVFSQIKIDFSMVLNLLLSHKPDQVRDLLDKSFAAYLMTTKGRKKVDGKFVGASARRLWGDFLEHLNFLKYHRYVGDDGKLTPDGEWASQLRIDHPLMVAEGFRKNLFPKTSAPMLAGIMAAFVNERETDDDALDSAIAPKTLYSLFHKTNNGLKSFAEELRRNEFPAPTLCFLPTVTVYLWAKGEAWERVLEISRMPEGNLAMLILRTADNLRHIRNIGDVFPDAARTSSRAIDLILRDPVITTFGV